MTIKKPMKKVTDTPATEVPATGGATIADRFKLDAPAPAPKKSSAADTAVLVVSLIALAVSGVLAYVLYQHWQYLMPA